MALEVEHKPPQHAKDERDTIGRPSVGAVSIFVERRHSRVTAIVTAHTTNLDCVHVMPNLLIALAIKLERSGKQLCHTAASTPQP